MVHPNTIGDVAIHLPQLQSLNDLFPSSSAQAAVKGTMPPVLRSHEFEARVQLTFRQQPPPSSSSSSSLMVAGQPAPAELLTGGMMPGSPVAQGNAPPVRRSTVMCKGKFVVSTTTKTSMDANAAMTPPMEAMSSPMSVSGTPTKEARTIRQYDMMLVQSEFEPGQPFFSMTFSKTLVQQGHQVMMNGSMTPPSSSSSASVSVERGLMLSGHYTAMRNYDCGTVRVHLPGGLLQGDLAPQFSNGRDDQQSGGLNARSESFVPPEHRSTPHHHHQQQQQHHHHQQPYGSQTPPHSGGRSVRFCYGCGETGHLHKDCPRDQLFCYNCNQAGHSSKNCKKPKPWEQQQQQQVQMMAGTQAAPGGFSNMVSPSSPVQRHPSPDQQSVASTTTSTNTSGFMMKMPSPPQRSLSVPDAWNMSALHDTLAYGGGMHRYGGVPPPGLLPRPIGSPSLPHPHVSGSALSAGAPPSSFFSGPYQQQQQQMPGRCFLCGGYGHAAKSCPSFGTIEEEL